MFPMLHAHVDWALEMDYDVALLSCRSRREYFLVGKMITLHVYIERYRNYKTDPIAQFNDLYHNESSFVTFRARVTA